MLADFLREIRDVSIVRKRNEEAYKAKRVQEQAEPPRRPDSEKDNLPDITLSHPERAVFIQENDRPAPDSDGERSVNTEPKESHHRDNGGRCS